jgi:integrase
METTFDVKIWSLRELKGKPGKGGKFGRTSYRVRWVVGKDPWSKNFATKALAESFRSQLIAAQKSGEAFRCVDGLPVSTRRDAADQSWFEFCQRYVDLKWTRAAAKSRAGNADTLATATVAMLATTRGKPDDKVLRKAMTGWAYNTKRRDTEKPAEIERALKWLATNTLPVSRLDDHSMSRAVLDQIALKMDGKPAAAKTVSRKRSVLHNALEYAVEMKLVTKNRLPDVKWTAPKEVKAIDKRVVINPAQARRLLAGVAAQHIEGQPRRSSGPALEAYFGAQYYAALRPEEAAMLSKADLLLPDLEWKEEIADWVFPKGEDGWGELLLSQAAPTAGAAWTDSNERRDRRQLKQRARGEVRRVPSPPPLTKLLHAHLARFGTAADGRLFRSLTGGFMSESTVNRVWGKARKEALTEQEYTSVLCRRPYDLRHACVSFWLAAGVPARQVADWAGHSLSVLLEIYAAIIAEMEDSARDKISRALGLFDGQNEAANRPQLAGDDRGEPGTTG